MAEPLSGEDTPQVPLSRSPRIPVLYFVRAGRPGGAAPDLALAYGLKAVAPEIDLQWASYGSGLTQLQTTGLPVIVLALPEENSYAATLAEAIKAIHTFQPAVVVSHDEFAALVAAKLLGVPAVYLSLWLPQAGSLAAESLAHADAVFIFAAPGLFIAPHPLRLAPEFVGQVVHPRDVTRRDRPAFRCELGLADDALLIVVAPSEHSPEETAPIADKVLAAFAACSVAKKRLIWHSRCDHARLLSCTEKIAGVEVTPSEVIASRVLAAADVIIVKDDYGWALEAAALGVPSVSLSFGARPIDEFFLARLSSNIALIASATDPDTLQRALMDSLGESLEGPLGPTEIHDGREAARALAEKIRQFARQSSGGAATAGT
jgi:hypothetical protein